MSRRGTYRGIYSSLPDDPDFQQLTPSARLVFYTVRTCAQAGPGCIFRYYLEVVATQSGLSAKETRRALSELQAADWIRIEEPVLWIRNGLRYDPTVTVADPKHKTAILRALDGLPHRQIVVSFCEYYDLPRPYPWPLPSALGRGGLESGRLRSPEEDTETEKETEKETDTSSSASADPATRIPSSILERVPALRDWPCPDALAALWNDHAKRHGYPQIESVSPARRAKAKAYLRDFPAFTFWNTTFSAIRLSAFLMGQRPGSNGHQSFRADFDWLLTKGKDGTENAVKVHDGRYADVEARR